MNRYLCALFLMFCVDQALAEPAAGTILKEPKTGIEFAWVPSGCFNMGSNEGERFEKPVHSVCLNGFWMGKHEVTQEQYKLVMGNNPSDFKNKPTNPVDQVSWDDASAFAHALARLTGIPARLPSEAEWEYACRAGEQDGTYCGTGEPTEIAWTGINSGDQTHPVGSLRGNAWGLFDMSGNVWEWVQDCWNLSYDGAPSDGSAWMSGNCERPVARGGAWDVHGLQLARAAKRGRGDHRYRLNVVGLRVAVGPQH